MNKLVYDVKAKVVNNIKVAERVYRLELDMPKISAKLRAGQFMHLRIGTGVDPLLRRPFSLYKIIKAKKGAKKLVGIMYQVVGKGTLLLTEKQPGETVEVMGPLGNGFSITDKILKKERIILVSGGIGVVPLVSLAQELKRKTKARITAFVGVGTKQDLVCVQELKSIGCDVKVSTDDGSKGFKGYVSQLLEESLTKRSTLNPERYIYACGPFPMLRALSMIAKKYEIPGQVSVDEMMGCGIGACLGCVIKTKDKNSKDKDAVLYKRICKDGPVFDVDEIVWED
ncbi:MAG: dihydroorotate dehydrogenase electron transfer subunit [Candidatus Omnitrophota bacterium]